MIQSILWESVDVRSIRRILVLTKSPTLKVIIFLCFAFAYFSIIRSAFALYQASASSLIFLCFSDVERALEGSADDEGSVGGDEPELGGLVGSEESELGGLMGDESESGGGEESKLGGLVGGDDSESGGGEESELGGLVGGDESESGGQ